MKSRSVLVLAILTTLAGTAPAADPMIVTVGQSNKRIVRCSEGSTIELPDGRLMMIYQDMTKGDGDSDFFPSQLVARFSNDGGRNWGLSSVVVDNDQAFQNVMSPSLARLSDGAIVLTFIRNHKLSKKVNVYPPISAFAWVTRDEGKSFKPLATMWSEKMMSLCNSTLKRLSSGRLIQTVNRETSMKGQPDHWQAGVVWSDDDGKNWKVGDSWVDAPKRGAMEPHLAETNDGNLLMVMRTQMGSVYKSESRDSGRSWSRAFSLGVESPESCPELVRLPGTGDLLLIYNASQFNPRYASHFGKRTPLSTSISKDGGRSWSLPRNIETDPGYAFSNPGALVTRQGKVIVNYWASKYKFNGQMSNYPIDLKVAVIDIKWLYGER
jgi:sialidase-1